MIDVLLHAICALGLGLGFVLGLVGTTTVCRSIYLKTWLLLYFCVLGDRNEALDVWLCCPVVASSLT
jgi:hypothetical protein